MIHVDFTLASPILHARGLTMLVVVTTGTQTVGAVAVSGNLGSWWLFLLLGGRPMNTLRKSAKRRATNGNLLAEMPAGLYLLFIGIGLPMLVMASMFTRSFLLYQATIDSCKKAARAASFTEAKTKATDVFNQNAAAWSGVSGTPTFSVLVKPIGPGSTEVKTAPLPNGSIQVSQKVYLARVVVAGQVEPLIRIGNTWQGMSIPGLTQPYPLEVNYVSYFENPSGLVN